MKKNAINLGVSFFSVAILVGSLLSFFTVGFCQTDVTAPLLGVRNVFRYTSNKECIIQGFATDESRIQKVTVNSVNATGFNNDNLFVWQCPVTLKEGDNNIVVVAFDNSSNHNYAMKIFVATYQTVSYDGPTIEVVSVDTLPENNMTIQCVVNPNGPSTNVHLWYSMSSYDNSPFQNGIALGAVSGFADVVVNYTFPSQTVDAGDNVSYLIRASNNQGTFFTKVETVEITESAPTIDTEPPQIDNIPGIYEEYNTPKSPIMVMGNAWDESGIKNVTVNGQLATLVHRHTDWFNWHLPVNLTEGVNEIEILAYDDSPNHLMSKKTFKVNYQPSVYLGPTIDLVLPTNITANSITFNCVINPKIQHYPTYYGDYVRVFVYYNYSDLDTGSFLYTEDFGNQYFGFDEISLSYILESENPQSTISFILWAFNSKGVAFTEPMTVTLKPGVTDFSVTPQTPYANAPVVFDASSCFSPYGAIESYQFDFGDGNTTETQSATISHAYQSSGTFDVNLTIVDVYGVTNSTTKTVTVLSDSTAPTTSDNYNGLWHDSDFEITLSAVDSKSGVADIHYKINQGSEKTVSKDGQPKITTENKNNYLQFWSVDNAGNVEETQLVSGIKLDKTSPSVENLVIVPDFEIQENQTVQVVVDVYDAVSGIDEVILSYSTDNQSTWQDVSMYLNSTSKLWHATIPGQQIWTNVNYKVTAHDNVGNTASTQAQTKGYEVIPEFSSWIILPLLVSATIAVLVVKNRLNKTVKK